MINYEAIGRRIAVYRKSAGLTQAQLSESLDISDSYISQIERGKSKISLQRLSEIADILNIDIALLVSDKAICKNMSINTEIHEIIKDWPEERISLLTSVLMNLAKEIKK